MKKKVNIILIMMVFLLGLIACNSNRNILEGKYIGLNTEVYFEFSKGGTYTTNDPGEDYKGIPFPDYGTYSIENGELTLFAGDDPENPDVTYYMGSTYKNMICYKWEGELPLQNQETEVTYENWSIADKIQFNKDDTVDFIYMVCSGCNNSESHVHDYQVVETKTGTYEVEGNKVTCKDSDGLLTIFYDTEDGILCVDFIKE